MALKKKGEEKDLEPTNTQVEGNVFEETNTELPVEGKAYVAEEPKTITVSADQLNSMFEKFQEKLQNEYDAKLKEALKNVPKPEATVASSDALVATDILNDWMEKPVTFFSYSSDYGLHGDVRMGREVLPPGGKIKFKNLLRKQRRVGRDIQVICVSVVNIQSKSQLEYLRQHSLYGITFHESMDQALSIDAMFAQKLIEANQQVSRMTEHDVITRCKLEGIGASQDLQLMRKLLTEKLAKQSKAQMEQYYNQVEENLRKMALEKETK